MTAIRTNGIGSTNNTAHLNLTGRTLAEVWWAKKVRKLRPVVDPASRFRLRNGKGYYLHLSGQHFTSAAEAAWCGNRSQLNKLRGAIELARGLRVEVVS